MVELVDTQDLGSCAVRCVGSSPILGNFSNSMGASAKIQVSEEGILFFVKVTPKSSKNAIIGWKENILCLRIAAAPEKGKANEEVESFLASQLDIGRSYVRVIQGHSSRNKRVCASGISLEQFNLKLGHAPS